MAKPNKSGRCVITVKPSHHRAIKAEARKGAQDMQAVVDRLMDRWMESRATTGFALKLRAKK